MTNPCSNLLCVECGLAHGPLLAISGTDDVIHARCAERSEHYGLCRYCTFNRDPVAFFVEELNSEGECPDHQGESAPSGPDIDDIVENIMNN